MRPSSRVGSGRQAPSGEGIPWIHVGVFLAGTILVVLFTAHQIGTERETALTHWRTRIATIAADRTRLVSSWLAARRADAEVLAAFPAVRALLAGQGRDEEALARHLSRVASAYGYVGIVVSDSAGRTVARSAPDAALATGLLGVAWGMLYVARRSIIAPMVSHAGFDLLQILQFAATRA